MSKDKKVIYCDDIVDGRPYDKGFIPLPLQEGVTYKVRDTKEAHGAQHGKIGAFTGEW